MTFIPRLLAELDWATGDDGQTMAEYAVVLGVITLGVVLAIGFLSGAITSAISSVVGFL